MADPVLQVRPSLSSTWRQPIAFTEGPAVAHDGSIYFTNISTDRIVKLAADGGLSTRA
jgi:hypothetical protein